ncbi:hypothetical protein PMZ80_004284 [Knufia obscura]|uniref:Uncharacterized protein n=2 Tax=Knufia TaxID=430999 RepID=A0AAN8E9M4_9EURO|nr:hypothetical protein PMZ80_004284 [Knufia obscura]KAK5949218.1 hypothetical protein OHC33_009759 [Knufia fluminis]
MKSLLLLLSCWLSCHAAAINPFRYARDVTIGPPMQASITLSKSTPGDTSANATYSEPVSTRTLIPPTTRPFTTDIFTTPPVPPTSTDASEPQSTRTIITSTTRPFPPVSPASEPTTISLSPPTTTVTSTDETSSDTSAAQTSIDSGLTPIIVPPPITTTTETPALKALGTSPPSPSPANPDTPTQDPTTICKNISSNPDTANYTQPYSCTLKPGTDFAILGMYYDTCSPINTFIFKNQTVSAALPQSTSTSAPPLLYPPPSNTSTSTSTPTSTPSPEMQIDTTLCCDPTYSTPTTFDTLCIWGNGTSINLGDLPPDFDPASIRRPKGEKGRGRCMVSPVIRPRARCVQVGYEGEGTGGT